MPAVRIVVRGRVQGVGFRFHTYESAFALGIKGEVWNRSDRSVEVIAEHPDQKVLDEFLKAVEAGPGYVKDVESWPCAEKGFTKFEVGPTR